MKNILLSLTFLMALQGVSKDIDPVAVWTKQYDAILKQHVRVANKSGIRAALVDYKSLSRNQAFMKLYNDLETLPDITKQPTKVQLAFWINAYNYLTLYKVAQKPYITKLTDLNGFIYNVWKQPAGVISGKTYTLDQIEHDIIRKQFNEPRIHVALVCAALSCPDLRAEAYRSKTLDKQLSEQISVFLKNSRKGMLTVPGEKTIYLSSIFKWYDKDFEGGAVAWLVKKKYLSPTVSDYRVKFFSYNWSLNSMEYQTEPGLVTLTEATL